MILSAKINCLLVSILKLSDHNCFKDTSDTVNLINCESIRKISDFLLGVTLPDAFLSCLLEQLNDRNVPEISKKVPALNLEDCFVPQFETS